MGAPSWLGNLAQYFPATGTCSKRGVSPPKAPKGGLLHRIRLIESAEFRERTSKAWRRKAPNLRGEACPKVKTGRPLPPSPSRKPEVLADDGYNIAFRFGVERASKHRACDDLEKSLTKTACATLTPIQLVSRGHLSQICKPVCRGNRGGVLFYACQEEAYKQHALGPSDMGEVITPFAARPRGTGAAFPPVPACPVRWMPCYITTRSRG